MAAFTKRGDTWRAQVTRTIDGKKIRINETFPTKAHAQAWATEKEAELLKIRRTGLTASIALPGNDGKTLGDALDRYSKEVSPTKKGCRWEQLRIKAFIRDYPFLSGVQLPKLTPEHIATWRDERLLVVSKSTVNREMILLSGVITHARKEWRWCTLNPVRDVRKPTPARPRDIRLTDTDLDEFAAALDFTGDRQPTTQRQEVGLMFLLAIETAMRSGELVGLEWSRVHLDKRFLALDATKNGSKRNVPLSARAVELLKLMEGKNGNTVFSVTDQIRDVLFRRHRPEHLAHIHFHDSRHEATTRLSKKLDVLSLARVTGHRDLKSLMIYYNESAEDMAGRL